MGELVIRGVDKIYRSRKASVHAVKAFDLIVKPGEIVALLGSSGCGKTSTLRMIAGFEDVSNGTITLDGKAIHNLAPAQRGVAMAFEAVAHERVKLEPGSEVSLGAAADDLHFFDPATGAAIAHGGSLA